MPLPIFQYHADVIARYPNLIAGALLFHGVANGPAPETLRNAFQAEQQSTLARIGSTPLSDIPSLAAWRSVFRSFGVEPTQYRSAPEALLRRLTKTGDLPTINTLVDLGNLVSIRYGLPVAIFDLRAVRGLITVCFADGSEHYTPLGQSEVEHPEQGEVIFVDTGRAVLARR